MTPKSIYLGFNLLPLFGQPRVSLPLVVLSWTHVESTTGTMEFESGSIGRELGLRPVQQREQPAMRSLVYIRWA